MEKEQFKLLVSVPEVAYMLGISGQSIYNQLSQKTFPVKAVRVGRLVKFRLTDIEKYVEDLPAA